MRKSTVQGTTVGVDQYVIQDTALQTRQAAHRRTHRSHGNPIARCPQWSHHRRSTFQTPSHHSLRQ